MTCRHCGKHLSETVLDLGTAPPSNSYLTQDSLGSPEHYYPLRVLLCTNCWLVQAEDFTPAESLFTDDYAYFSGYSSTWRNHVSEYSTTVVKRFGLNSQSNFVEIATNDGTLLDSIKAHGIPCLGIEPTASTAKVARSKGLHIVEEFFGSSVARKLASAHGPADAIAANNVLAHVPDINDFVNGCRMLLKPHGFISFEFPHLLNLVSKNQFDTIYHEHFSYLSLIAVSNICRTNGLHVFDVEEISTHGGSLRVFVQHADNKHHEESKRVNNLIRQEEEYGLQSVRGFKHLQTEAETTKNCFVEFLLDARKKGKKVCGYGAAAKGNTLLNFAGIRKDLLQFVADKNPAKQGKFLPGSRIPICDELELRDQRPDVVVILPWNIRDEVIRQLDYLTRHGCEFVTAIPNLTICSRVSEVRPI